VGASETVRELVDAMAGIQPGLLLDALAARRLCALTPDEAALALGELVAGARESDAARKALGAICRALLGAEDVAPAVSVEQRRAIRAAAAALGLGAVAALFTEATAERALDEEGRRIDPAFASLTLGHRTQLARVENDRDRLARLALDDDPSVVRNLLLNPRLTEELVVRVAARRRAPGEVLAEVARSRRWSARSRVRRALALNPSTPPAMASTLLPQLIDADLREVAACEVLHPAVRRAAAAVLDARAPVD
jgi:hypothetical protein